LGDQLTSRPHGGRKHSFEIRTGPVGRPGPGTGPGGGKNPFES